MAIVYPTFRILQIHVIPEIYYRVEHLRIHHPPFPCSNANRAHRAAVDSRIRMHYERLSHSPAHISRPLSSQNVCATPARLRYRFPMLAQRATLYCDWWTQVAPSLAHRWLLMLTLFSNFLISFLPGFPLLRFPPPPFSAWWTIVVCSNSNGPADGTKVPVLHTCHLTGCSNIVRLLSNLFVHIWIISAIFMNLRLGFMNLSLSMVALYKY